MRFQGGGAVHGQDRDAVAGIDAQAAQAPGEAVNTRVEFRIGEAAAAIDDGGGAG